jgi:hypothetical protein
VAAQWNLLMRRCMHQWSQCIPRWCHSGLVLLRLAQSCVTAEHGAVALLLVKGTRCRHCSRRYCCWALQSRAHPGSQGYRRVEGPWRLRIHGGDG